MQPHLPTSTTTTTQPLSFSLHAMSMDAAAWLLRAMTHLTHEIPFERLPAEAREDALEHAARLKACLELDEPFILRLDDPTDESWVN